MEKRYHYQKLNFQGNTFRIMQFTYKFTLFLFFNLWCCAFITCFHSGLKTCSESSGLKKCSDSS